MVYLLQVMVYSALMLLVYMLLLRNQAMHSFNRFYLLLNCTLPVLLPFIIIPGSTGAVIIKELGVRSLPELIVLGSQQQRLTGFKDIAMLVYIAGSAFAFSILLWNYYSILRIVRKHEKRKEDGYTLVLNTGYGPGSWHKYIFLPAHDINENILKHEQAHVQLKHTFDISFISLLQVFFWPNLFLFFIKKELKEIHEFQADASVKAETDMYAELLLSGVFQACIIPSTHSFIIHPIKRRIMMLQKNGHSNILNSIRGIAAVVVCIAFTGTVISLQSCKGDVKEKKIEKKIIIKKQVGDSVYKIADEMPEFEGDMAAFMSDNIEYPESAKKNKIEGKVIVKFVIDKEGNVTKQEVVKSPDNALTAAALDMVRKMPKWKPAEKDGEKVSAELILPVLFKL